jgi:hypothetical protein
MRRNEEMGHAIYRVEHFEIGGPYTLASVSVGAGLAFGASVFRISELVPVRTELVAIS